MKKKENMKKSEVGRPKLEEKSPKPESASWRRSRKPEEESKGQKAKNEAQKDGSQQPIASERKYDPSSAKGSKYLVTSRLTGSKKPEERRSKHDVKGQDPSSCIGYSRSSFQYAGCQWWLN